MFTSLIYTPTKRIFSSNHDFFSEGNIALRAYWLERDAATQKDASMIRQEAETISTSFNDRSIFCELPSCIQRHGQPVSFPSITAYESHYEAQHRNTCSLCHLPFPGAHWLALHLDERHNILNQIKKDRGEKIYECFVETCAKHFSTPKMRRLHMIDKHGYPKFFPFDIVVTGTMSIERREQQQERKKRHQAAIKGPKEDTMDTHNESLEEETSTLSGDTMDIEIGALTASMSRIKIPSTISFGRGRKQVWHRSSQHESTEKKSSRKKSGSPEPGKKTHHDLVMEDPPSASKPNRRERRLAASIAREEMCME